MTSNQLSRAEIIVKRKTLDENKRHNIAQELLTTRELSEAAANNLRNYKINLAKNQIQRLANDQLNSREVQKIGETIRSNLAKELETNRHNLAEEELTRLNASITALGKPGKYSVGAILAAIFGLMPADEMERLYGKGKVTFTGQSTSSIEKPSSESVELPDWNKPLDVIRFGQEAVKLENLWDQYNQEQQAIDIQKRIQNVVDTHKEEFNPPYTGHNSSRRGSTIHGHSGTERDDEKDEIPLDFSNSSGPGINNLNVPGLSNVSFGPPVYYDNSNEHNNNISHQNDTPHGSTSGGTNYHVEGGLHSEGVIYAGGK